MLTPEAHAAVQATRNRRVGLLATEGTVAAGRYAELVRALDAGVELVPVACPRLVPLIESDDPFGPETTGMPACATPLKEAANDTVILGCTHYPLIRPIFQRVFGRDVQLVFSAEETAREVAETLARKGYRCEARGLVPLSHHGRSGGVSRDRRALPAAADCRGRARRARRARSGGMRNDGRRPDQLRPLELVPDFLEQPHGCVLYAQGKTKVLCTASIQEGAQRWLYGKGRGWLDRGVLVATGVDGGPQGPGGLARKTGRWTRGSRFSG